MAQKPGKRVVGTLAVGLLCAGALFGGGMARPAAQQANAGSHMNPTCAPCLRHGALALNPQPLPPRRISA